MVNQSIIHPVIAITGSSGAGTSTVKKAFGDVIKREGIKAVVIEGDSFHKFDRIAMKAEVAKYATRGERLSHFSANANLFDKLGALFKSYRETGKGKTRRYLHSIEEAEPYGLKPSEFTPWEDIAEPSDMLFYEGLHGGVEEVAPYVDFLVGVTPIINLEWIQKIQRDRIQRGYSTEQTVETIKQRIHDYVDYITPQFSLTHINFQRVPMVDTSNPFIAREIPTEDESLIVIRVKKEIIVEYEIDLVYLKNMISGSFISRRNTIVVPGPKMVLAMEVLVTPIIKKMLEGRVNIAY